MSLDNQIKEIINQSDTTTNKINSIETLFTNFVLQKEKTGIIMQLVKL